MSQKTSKVLMIWQVEYCELHLLTKPVIYRLFSDAMIKAKEAVQVSRETLKHAMEDLKTVTKNLKELQERAMELGLKSKVTVAHFIYVKNYMYGANVR